MTPIDNAHAAAFENAAATAATAATTRDCTASSRCRDEIPAATAATGLIPEPEPPEVRRPGYAVYDRATETKGGTFRPGVWHHGLREKGDAAPVPYDGWICSPLHVEAVTSCEGADFGRLLRFRNTLGHWREWAMPMHLLKGSGEELRGELLNMGVEIDPDGFRSLNRYLQSQRPGRHVTAATATGWHDPGLFIMPRQNIGEGDAIFQSEAANADDYRHGGTLEGWRESIGALCPGNPLLLLAVGAALAGPLLYHVQKQGGGFHVIGDSSTGKSTLIQAAASVWGEGEHYKRTWRATGNGLEGIAAQRNDTLLALDEIGEADPREIGAVVYALANGTGKARANRTGAARSARRWRVIVLSSGELGLAAMMAEGGKRTKAGQELRLLDVNANRGHGCWDTLHHHASGRHFSESIQRASVTHYGHAGPAFIRAILEDGEAHQLPDALASILREFPATSGQEARAAERFALVALALELARAWALVPIDDGEGIAAMRGLFDGWRAGRGAGAGEDAAILKCVTDFVSRHGDAMFSNLNGGGPVRDRAGWWKDNDAGRTWLFTSEGMRRAAPGYEVKRIVAALDSAGWIVERDTGRSAKAIRVDGRTPRLYHLAVEGF